MHDKNNPHNDDTLSLFPYISLHFSVAFIKQDLLGMKNDPDTYKATKNHFFHFFDILRHIFLVGA